MKIEKRFLQQLVPYERNARTHSYEQIAATIAKFGFTNPVLIGADGVMIAGHCRLLAAQRLGMAEVPTIVLDRIIENAGWDERLLRSELEALDDLDFDLNLVGFADAELDELLGDLEGGQPTGPYEREDDIPEPPVVPVSMAGVLGNHRLLCGDSMSATDVDRLLGAVKPLLMVTDPPYGVEYDPGWRNKAGAAPTKRTGKVLNDDRADWREAWALLPRNRSRLARPRIALVH